MPPTLQRDPPSNQTGHTNGQSSLSVVVPVFNSENSLRELVARLEPVLSGLADQFELILVNDGSRDRSWQVIEELVTHYQWIKGINLMRNYGQHNALLCGIRESCYNVIITMDDDLQQPPEEIPRLLEKLTAGYDVVYGTPEKIQQGFWRRLASQAVRSVLHKILGHEIARQVNPFRAFYTSARNVFAGYAGPSVSIDVLLAWGATRYAAVPVPYAPRRSGSSNYTFGKLVGHAMDMMTGFSTLPLRLATLIGFIFTFLGMGLFLYVIVRYFIEGGSVPGFPFLASMISIFSGATLFTLGVMGEYLSRIYTMAMGQPHYVIQKVLEHKDKML
jgi:undecaprenyl-phosphate 4-deoxy-4-formamido-L-arabinose transferase